MLTIQQLASYRGFYSLPYPPILPSCARPQAVLAWASAPGLAADETERRTVVLNLVCYLAHPVAYCTQLAAALPPLQPDQPLVFAVAPPAPSALPRKHRMCAYIHPLARQVSTFSPLLVPPPPELLDAPTFSTEVDITLGGGVLALAGPGSATLAPLAQAATLPAAPVVAVGCRPADVVYALHYHSGRDAAHAGAGCSPATVAGLRHGSEGQCGIDELIVDLEAAKKYLEMIAPVFSQIPEVTVGSSDCSMKLKKIISDSSVQPNGMQLTAVSAVATTALLYSRLSLLTTPSSPLLPPLPPAPAPATAFDDVLIFTHRLANYLDSLPSDELAEVLSSFGAGVGLRWEDGAGVLVGLGRPALALLAGGVGRQRGEEEKGEEEEEDEVVTYDMNRLRFTNDDIKFHPDFSPWIPSHSSDSVLEILSRPSTASLFTSSPLPSELLEQHVRPVIHLARKNQLTPEQRVENAVDKARDGRRAGGRGKGGASAGYDLKALRGPAAYVLEEAERQQRALGMNSCPICRSVPDVSPDETQSQAARRHANGHADVFEQKRFVSILERYLLGIY